MKVYVTEQIAREVNLPEEKCLEIAQEVLWGMVRPAEFCREAPDGKTYAMMDDPDHRHGSISEIKLREATELDLAVFAVMREISRKRTAAALALKERLRG